MFTPARVFSLFLVAAGLICGPRSSPAQILQTSIDGSDLTVTYARISNADVSVEASTDLTSWSAANSHETLIENEDGSEFIKSSVAIPDTGTFFLRLKIASAWKVDLSWNAVSDPAVVGYRLYYSRTDGLGALRELDVGNSTTAMIFLPQDGKTYSFVVTCYDGAGIESPPSDPLSVMPPWPG